MQNDENEQPDLNPASTADLISDELVKVSQRYLYAMAAILCGYYVIRGAAYFVNQVGDAALILGGSSMTTALISGAIAYRAKVRPLPRLVIEICFCACSIMLVYNAAINYHFGVVPNLIPNVAFILIVVGLGTVSILVWGTQVIGGLVACWAMLTFIAAPDGQPFLFYLLSGVTISFLALMSRRVVVQDRLELEVALMQKARKLEAANKAKDRFLANMTHELRTPMTGVLGMVDLLRETRLTKEQDRLLNTAKTSAGYLMAIINDILDYSKLESGKFELKPAPLEATSVTRDVVEMLRGQAEGKQISVTVHTPDVPEIWVEGDSVRIGQVLFNLVGNAIKFTDKGGVDVYLEAQETNNEIKLDWRVRDTGAGIPQDRIPRLFERFEQLDDTATRRQTGTGLGLAIIQELVSLMEGEIGVESKIGEGSEFRVQIPLPRATPPAYADELPEEDPVEELTGPLNVLVAEDNMVNQMLVRRLLEKEGWRVTMTDNGEAAVAAATKSKEPFDLILMDVRMPVMDGPTATRIIKDKMVSPPPVIALTANTLKADVEQYLQAGMDAHVGKPIDVTELHKTVRKVLGNRLPV